LAKVRTGTSKAKRSAKNGGATTTSGGFARVLGWVAAASAILSFVFLLRKGEHLLADMRDRSRHIAELEDAAERQAQEHEYAPAWASLGEAATLAAYGGQLEKILGIRDIETRRIETRQENLGMDWLRNVHLTEGQTFSEVVDKVEPVLQHGIINAQGQRRGDLLAHIGLGSFLKRKDNVFGLEPRELYLEALEWRAEPS
jgi:hypothetical protein